jgi:hypothetical protein
LAVAMEGNPDIGITFHCYWEPNIFGRPPDEVPLSPHVREYFREELGRRSSSDRQSVLVLLSYVIGPAPMDLRFWPSAVLMMLIATLTASLVTNSGRSARQSA